jgi:hypothetical protein
MGVAGVLLKGGPTPPGYGQPYARPEAAAKVESRRVRADPGAREIEQLAAYHVMAMTLNGVRGQLEAAHMPTPCPRPPRPRSTQVILQLSAAAQTLVTSSH